MDVALSALVVILMVGGALAVAVGIIIKFHIRVVRKDKRPTRAIHFVTLGFLAFVVGAIAGQFTV